MMKKLGFGRGRGRALMAVFCLVAVLRVGGGEVIELRNERVSFRFAAQSGLGLTGISDIVTGRELLEPAVAQKGAALWNARLFQGAEMPTMVNSLSAAETRHSLTRKGSLQVLELCWDKIAVGDAPVLAVRVTVELEDGAALARWRLEAEARPPFRFWGVDFPCVSGIRDLGDDYLAVPNYMGRVFRPDGSEAFARNGNWDDRWIPVRVSPGTDGQDWRLEIDPVEDVAVQLRGGAVPLLRP